MVAAPKKVTPLARRKWWGLEARLTKSQTQWVAIGYSAARIMKKKEVMKDYTNPILLIVTGVATFVGVAIYIATDKNADTLLRIFAGVSAGMNLWVAAAQLRLLRKPGGRDHVQVPNK